MLFPFKCLTMHCFAITQLSFLLFIVHCKWLTLLRFVKVIVNVFDHAHMYSHPNTHKTHKQTHEDKDAPEALECHICAAGSFSAGT